VARQYFLAKSEPETYAWETLLREGHTRWDGVRNFEARNHLRSMKRGDLVLFYHSGKERAVVGVARVTREAYPDPTAREGDWSVVDVEPVTPLKQSVTLAQIKDDPELADILLVRRSRLSVMPLERAAFERILKLGGTRLP
jgi:predicted RNA-binding protein with PUA-like domain